MTLAEFLLARIAEDEEVARAALTDPIATWNEQDWIEIDVAALTHVRRWDPARVLADCEARRRIVERYRVCAPNYDEGNRLEGRVLNWTMRLFALRYADHHEYREEWRP